MREYVQYQNLKYKWDDAASIMTLSLPWIGLKLKLDQHPFGADGKIQSNILEKLSQFPICRALPLKAYPESTKCYSDKYNDLNLTSPNDALKSLNIDYQFSKNKNQWLFDVQNILDKSQIGDSQYDSTALYGILTELRLHIEHNSDSALELFKKLSQYLTENEAIFFESASYILEQTYFVTSHCNEALTPALKNFLPARDAISQFINEERNHDRLVLKSLLILNPSAPCRSKVAPETKALMSLLKNSAEKFFLGFSCIVGAFEGAGYSNEDPLAKLLRQSSKPDSARGIQQHYMINKNGNHSAVGLNFIQHLPIVNKATALQAIALVELATRLRIELVSNINRYIENGLN